MFLYKVILELKGSYIGINSEFKNMPIFPHGINSIFISGEAKLGYDCVIFQQVTIGSNTLIDSKGKGAPCIGNNVYIGAGAKIIGNVNIGNNVRIGANCVVVTDVPDNSVVVLQQSKIIENRNNDNRFFCKKDNRWGYLKNHKWMEVHDKDILDLLN